MSKEERYVWKLREDWYDIIYDKKTNKRLRTDKESIVALLNQQDQQIAELKAENERLKDEICKYEITLMDKNSQLKEKDEEIEKLNNALVLDYRTGKWIKLCELQQQLKDNTKQACEKIKELEKELEILLIENKNLKFTFQKLPQMIDNFNKPVRVDVQGIIDCYMKSLDRIEALQKIKNRWKEMYYNLDEKYKKLKQSKKNKS